MAQLVVLFPRLHGSRQWDRHENEQSLSHRSSGVLILLGASLCAPAELNRVPRGLPTATQCSDSASAIQGRIQWAPVARSFSKRHVHSCFKTAMLIMIRKRILNVQVKHDFCKMQFEIKTRKFRCLWADVCM